ncbi:unnamed protein product, partial [marine sediment metagenome]
YRYPELKRAWVLKESFRAWYRETNRSWAEEMLGLLKERVEGDSLPEFKELLHTLTNWEEETLMPTSPGGSTSVAGVPSSPLKPTPPTNERDI